MFELTLKLDTEDWKIFQKYCLEKGKSQIPKRPMAFVFDILLWVAVGFVYVHFFNEIHWPTIGLATVILVATFGSAVLYSQRLFKASEPYENGTAIDTYTYRFDEKGITWESDRANSFVAWDGVLDVVEKDDYLFLMIDNIYGLCFPKGKIDNFDEIVRYSNEKAIKKPQPV